MFEEEAKAKKAPFPGAAKPFPPKKPAKPADDGDDQQDDDMDMKKPMGKTPKKGFGDAPVAPGPVVGQPPVVPTKPAKPKPGLATMPNNIQPNIGKAKIKK